MKSFFVSLTNHVIKVTISRAFSDFVGYTLTHVKKRLFLCRLYLVVSLAFVSKIFVCRKKILIFCQKFFRSDKCCSKTFRFVLILKSTNQFMVNHTNKDRGYSKLRLPSVTGNSSEAQIKQQVGVLPTETGFLSLKPVSVVPYPLEYLSVLLS